MSHSSLLPARVVVPPQVLFQELSGECVLLNMATEQYHGLDDVGTQMWKALVETGRPEAALERLQAYYAVDRETLHRDLAALIETLRTAQLLKTEPV